MPRRAPPPLARLPDDDVACLVLICAMLVAGGACRRWLIDGFRCDCIRIFLHPRFLEYAYRALRGCVRRGRVAWVSRRAWTVTCSATAGLSHARITPPATGVPATLVRALYTSLLWRCMCADGYWVQRLPPHHRNIQNEGAGPLNVQ